MIKQLPKLLIAGLVSIILIFPLAPLSKVFAGGSLYLSPGSATVVQGATFSVSVRVNTGGTPANAVTANLTYPTASLDFLGISSAGSAFEIEAPSSGGGGSITISRGTLSPVVGDKLLATLTFRAKVSSGLATVSFSGGSAIVNDGINIMTGSSGGTYSFTSTTSTPKPVDKTAPVTSTSTPKPVDKTAPVISNIKVSKPGLNSATISWKTNEPANSTVNYGISQNLGLSASNGGLRTSQVINLSGNFLVPGTTYYYKVISADEAGNAATSKILSFKTKGYSIQIKVSDPAGKPLSGIKVKIYPGLEEATTDKEGIVKFEDISLGKHGVNLTSGEETFGAEIDVKASKSRQEYQVTAFAGEVSLQGILRVALPAFVVVAILALIAILVIWEKRKGKLKEAISNTLNPPQNPPESPPDLS
ncbi:MAG: hypothetical protein A2172_02405 [Candidatus Woykebacteria bacterium RBG_13_40_15]|uniref:Fibronectin type-III domain-containing protein n=1 Tax=Candidatus Woykebacteria bacterium RBG_13_40_15 TaxID=1802593 RepID=A0A1G1W6C3_9BACT|nr:MAG: hypothetical protein A2172_02405 [Candidatus Woykebacteria bacterium RBG_13_40_15]